MSSVTMTPRNLWIYWKRLVHPQHVSGPTHLAGHTLDLIITRSSDDVVLASPEATFPSPIILIFSALLASRDQLYHAKH